jgi:cAMP phosphodiesterase
VCPYTSEYAPQPSEPTHAGALMELFVAGCHGGETPKHRTCAFVLDGTLAIDAGALTSGLSLVEQKKLKAVVVSHAHLDHIRDLATLVDNRTQMDAEPLEVFGIPETLKALKKHFFNNVIWPDFTVIPNKAKPALRYRELSFRKETAFGRYAIRPVPVSHTIDCAALFIRGPGGTIVYSGDTGPTDTLWTELNKLDDLKVLMLEVSFPESERKLAMLSGHHTPKTLAQDLAKYKSPSDLNVLLYHIKPFYERAVERELSKLRGFHLEIPKLGNHYLF